MALLLQVLLLVAVKQSESICSVSTPSFHIGTPSFHIVSRSEVAQYCKEPHRRWLETPGRKGRPHKDNPIRRFEDPDGRYLDKWEALGLGENVVA